MKWRVDKYDSIEGMPGKKAEGVIVIDYDFPSGLIPGTRNSYRADHRTAYLPNNDQGKLALGMLMVAFERKLTFMVGTSLTTNEKDVIVWTGIHHKTSRKGGVHGYPDPKYFDNLFQELKERGITPEDVNPKPRESGTIEVKAKQDGAPAKSGWGWF